MFYLFAEFGLDTDRRELSGGASPIPVEPKVFDLLVYLIRNRDRVVSKDDLIAAIWNGRIVSESALATCINAARSAIGDSGETQRLIKTLPRRGIRFVGSVVEKEGRLRPVVSADTASSPWRPSLVLSDKPTIAVLPFTNMSGDPEQEYFSDGIAEDIITDLSRFRSLAVIARHSSFQFKEKAVDVRRVGRDLGVQYVVEGSVRISGDHLRITTQLIECAAGTHLWSERYDRNLADLFEVQDDVVQSIVGSIAGQVSGAAFEKVRRKRTENLGAYDCYLRGLAADQSTGPDADVEGGRWYEKALELDPDYAEPLAQLSLSAWHQARYSDSPDRFERAIALANKAVALDPNNSWSHCALGLATMWGRSLAAAESHIETALRLNPNDADQLMMCSSYYFFAGQTEEQRRLISTAKKLNPLPPPFYRLQEAMNEYYQRHYETAAQLLEGVGPNPNYWVHCWRAACYVKLGKMSEARNQVAKALKLKGSLTIRSMMAEWPFAKADDLNHVLEPLREAGLPD